LFYNYTSDLKQSHTRTFHHIVPALPIACPLSGTQECLSLWFCHRAAHLFKR